MVDKQCDLGVCISWDQIFEIWKKEGKNIYPLNDQLNAVCPPHLNKGTFIPSTVINNNHQINSPEKKPFNRTDNSYFYFFKSSLKCSQMKLGVKSEDKTPTTAM